MSGHDTRDHLAISSTADFTEALWNRALQSRRGLTLLELVGVLILVGIFTAVAMTRLGASPIADFASRSDARRLALDLLQIQRRAISTGDNHYIEFVTSGSKITGYRIYRRPPGGGVQEVDDLREFPHGESVTTTHNQLEYTFSGAALADYVVTFAGPNQTRTVSVVPATGTVRVTH
jgi:type II secretory pathway pseudopilin PulG